jgi:hypothetical protein
VLKIVLVPWMAYNLSAGSLACQMVQSRSMLACIRKKTGSPGAARKSSIWPAIWAWPAPWIPGLYISDCPNSGEEQSKLTNVVSSNHAIVGSEQIDNIRRRQQRVDITLVRIPIRNNIIQIPRDAVLLASHKSVLRRSAAQGLVEIEPPIRNEVIGKRSLCDASTTMTRWKGEITGNDRLRDAGIVRSVAAERGW